LVADSQQIEATTRLVGLLRRAAPAIAHDVAIDLGPGADATNAQPIVERFLAAVAAGGARVGEADLVRLRAEGAAAARQGQPLAAPIDAYLSTAWVAWDHALRIVPTPDPDVLGALGAALLRAGDDIAAALADGFTAAERSLASTAGAMRQAILEELLTTSVMDAAATTRLSRRAALVGLDVAATYHVLVLRPEAEGEGTADLVQELIRRLGRDPARRPSLVAERGADVVAIAGGTWRDGVPFGDAMRGLTAGAPWSATLAGPMALDGLAIGYAEAVDALRVVSAISAPGLVVPVSDVALERALVADPSLAALGVERWVGPLERAGRGGPELVRTVEAWLAAGESVVAAARVLRVAPRTVSYRLDRVAGILGVRILDADTRARLSAALLTRRLLAGPRGSVPRAGRLASKG
jgi:hypothetical protein